MKCNPSGVVECLYLKPGIAEGEQRKFEKNDGDKLTDLTETAYSMLAIDILEDTTPGKKAVRYTSGGQEDKFSVEKHVLTDQFIKSPHFFNPKVIPEKSEEELLGAYKSLSESEKPILIFDLIKYKRSTVVEKFVRDGLVGPNIISLKGEPLLHAAIREDDQSLFKTLLEKGADPNCQDNDVGHPAIVIALTNRNKTCFEVLLADSRTNVNLINKEGMPPPIFFSFIPGAMTDMINAGANMHIPCGSDRKQTILSLACRYPLPNENRKQILETGVIPNRGIPSPIESAAVHGDAELIDLLVKAGANPWAQQFDGHIPIHEILMKAPRSMINKLLEIPGANFNVTNSSGENPLDIAIARHDVALADELLKRGARMGLNPYDKSFSRNTVLYLIHLDNLPFLKRVLAFQSDQGPNLVSALYKYLVNNPQKIDLYLKEGIFPNPNAVFPEIGSDTLFWRICMESEDWNNYQPLIETCLSLKANVNQTGHYFFEEISLIELVLKNRNKELAELLLKHGLDKKTFQQAIIKLSGEPFLRSWLEENGFLKG